MSTVETNTTDEIKQFDNQVNQNFIESIVRQKLENVKADIDYYKFDLNQFYMYNSIKCTALHVAVRTGSLYIARCLINNGADMNIKDSNGYTAFHYAISNAKIHGTKHRVWFVRFLLSKGANIHLVAGLPDKENSIKKTCLYLAAAHNYYKIVSLLLEHGANVNDTSSYCPLRKPYYSSNDVATTALHASILNNHKEITCLLLKHGAVITNPSILFKYIVTFKRKRMFNLLLANKVNVQIALEIAVQLNKKRMVYYVLQKGAIVTDELMTSVKENNNKRIQRLFTNQLDIQHLGTINPDQMLSDMFV